VAWYGAQSVSVGVSIGHPIGWFPLGPGEFYRPHYRHTDRHRERINRVITNGQVTLVKQPNYRYRDPRFSTWVPGDRFHDQPIGRVRRQPPSEWRRYVGSPTPPANIPGTKRRQQGEAAPPARPTLATPRPAPRPVAGPTVQPTAPAEPLQRARPTPIETPGRAVARPVRPQVPLTESQGGAATAPQQRMRAPRAPDTRNERQAPRVQSPGNRVAPVSAPAAVVAPQPRAPRIIEAPRAVQPPRSNDRAQQPEQSLGQRARHFER
jgi:hypothetical protein